MEIHQVRWAVRQLAARDPMRAARQSLGSCVRSIGRRSSLVRYFVNPEISFSEIYLVIREQLVN
eukprot:6110937-Pleurochrysis_carterae.AAC.3